jgi:hypothetical protein
MASAIPEVAVDLVLPKGTAPATPGVALDLVLLKGMASAVPQAPHLQYGFSR